MGGRKGKRGNCVVTRIHSQAPRPLPRSQLPLVRDVDLALEDAVERLLVSKEEAVKTVSCDIEDIYRNASIPTIHPQKVRQKVVSVLELRRNAVKNLAVDQRTGKVRDQGVGAKKNRRKPKMSEVAGNLFEVKSDVPELEQKFYNDQKGERKLYIGSLDKKVTENNIKVLSEEQKKKEKKALREKELNAREEKEKMRVMEQKDVKQVGKSDVEDEEDDDEDFKSSSVKRKKQNSKESEQLPEFFEICERFSISETAASQVFNHFNKEVKLNQSQIHKKKKLARINKVKEFEMKAVTAIGFDERKDMTKVVDGVGKAGSKRFTKVKEEHCAVVLWPGDVFAGHVVPRGGKAVELAADLDDFFRDRPNIEIENVNTLLSDGCEKMLGWRTGVHASLEKIKGRRFQRVVCFHHHLEKSFEKVICLYRVYTTSPDSFVEPWNTLLSGDIHKVQLVEFQVVPNPHLLTLIEKMCPRVLKDLGTDHRTFIGLLRMAITGKVDEQYAQMKIGPMVTCRFTTTEARFLRCWLSTLHPSFEQTRIMFFIVYVWAEVFLTAKQMNRMEHGPRLLLLEVMLAKKHCTYPEFTMVKASLDYNGQYAHHEAILVSLLASPKPEDRQLAVDTIFSIREQGPRQWDTPTGQRPFKVTHSTIGGYIGI